MSPTFVTRTGKVVVREPRQCGPEAQRLAWRTLNGTGVTLGDIQSPIRTDRISRARHAVVLALWNERRYSQSDIARFLNRHPSSINLVIYARKPKPWVERKKAA